MAIAVDGATIDGAYQYAIPTEGGLVIVGPNISHVVLDPAGPLLAVTLQLPLDPFDGQFGDVRTIQAIQTLTLTAPGNSLSISSLALASNGIFSFIFIGSKPMWFISKNYG